MINELGAATARLLGIDGPWIFVVDGVRRVVGAGKWSEAEAIYSEVRRQVLSRLRKSAEFDLDLNFRVEDGVVSGELVARGPEQDRTQVQIVLVEKGVVFPGATGVVVHRMLARAPLTGNPEGLAWYPIFEEMTVPFERSLEDVRRENERYLDDFSAGGGGIVRKLSLSIDPSQVRVVAVVRDIVTGRVHQAIFAEPENLAELEKEGR